MTLSLPHFGALVASLGLVLAPALNSEASTVGPQRLAREAFVMGTRVRVVVEASDRDAAARASEATLAEIERFERLLSTWASESELAGLNAVPPGAPLPLSPDLAGLLDEAWDWAERTGRAFDPTVGPLVDAWGVRGTPRIPDEAERAAALGATGPSAWTLRGGLATRHSSAAWIDSGAFGKGAALRAVADLVRAHDVDRLLVDLGGQILALAPPDAPWDVEVAHPLDRARGVARLRVRGVSVATSGPSERGGHVLDPRTGGPVPAWGSVTVVAADALAADALSTALYVMGPEEGLRWARDHETAALFLRATDAGVRASWSEALDPWLTGRPITE